MNVGGGVDPAGCDPHIPAQPPIDSANNAARSPTNLLLNSICTSQNAPPRVKPADTKLTACHPRSQGGLDIIAALAAWLPVKNLPLRVRNAHSVCDLEDWIQSSGTRLKSGVTSIRMLQCDMRALVFDLDGTLIDTVYAQVIAWQRSFAAEEMIAFSPESTRKDRPWWQSAGDRGRRRAGKNYLGRSSREYGQASQRHHERTIASCPTIAGRYHSLTSHPRAESAIWYSYFRRAVWIGRAIAAPRDL